MTGSRSRKESSGGDGGFLGGGAGLSKGGTGGGGVSSDDDYGDDYDYDDGHGSVSNFRSDVRPANGTKNLCGFARICVLGGRLDCSRRYKCDDASRRFDYSTVDECQSAYRNTHTGGMRSRRWKDLMVYMR